MSDTPTTSNQLLPAAAKGKVQQRKILVPRKKGRKSTSAPSTSPIFENDVILREITSYLGIRDLKSCRLVSRKFKTHADKIIRKTHEPVMLGNAARVRKFANYYRKKVSQEQPLLTKFILKAKLTPGMLRGIGIFGAQMTSLTVSIEPRYRHTGYPGFINFESIADILQGTPNLITLNLNGVSFPDPHSHSIPGPPFPELRYLRSISITSTFDNFKMLPFHMINQTRYQNIARTLLRSSSALSSFSLDLRPSFPLSAANLETIKSWFYLCLIDLQPGLTELTLLGSYQSQIGEREHDLVFAHAATLEVLKLRLPASLSNVAVNNNLQLQRLFPLMRKLETLTLLTPCTPYNPPFPLLIIPPINPFPQLKKLSLSDNLLQAYFPLNSLFPSVHEISITYDERYNGEFAYTLKVNLFSLFPNMGKLNVQISGGSPDKVLKSVRKMFKLAKKSGENVKDLAIGVIQHNQFGVPYVYKLDQLLTGNPNPKYTLKLLAQLAKDNPLTPIDDLLSSTHRVSKPSITSFKNLECLKLEGTAIEPINDAVAFVSLYALSPLKTLILDHSHISNYYKELLNELHHNVVYN